VALPGVLLKKMNRGKVVIWTQDVWPDVAFAYGLGKNKMTVWLIEKFVSFIYNNCNTVITTSRPVQRDLSGRIGRIPYFIPNWPMNVFHHTSTQNGNRDNEQHVFTFEGNIGVMQNLNTIVMAFHQWSHNRRDVRFDIYGDGSAFPELQRIIRDNVITNVHLKGRVPVDQIPGIYEASDVLLIPLRNDPVLEKYVPAKFSTYLMAGKPIFGVISGAVKDYIDEYKLGHFANPDDIEEITKGFEYFLHLSPLEKMEIQFRSRNLYEKEFDATRNLELLTSLVFQPDPEKTDIE
jgi:glycosyltransferase involved in cell wall biosynthesis